MRGGQNKITDTFETEILYDNTGDNISNKNKWYSELTGLYWLWKNDNSDIKGLVHYRRYLVKFFPFFHKLTSKEIVKLLSKYDVILPNKKRLGRGMTVREQLENGVSVENIKLFENIIINDYPEYVPYMKKIWSEKSLIAFNIMICKKEIYDEYCKFLFEILFKLEEKVDFTSLTGYKVRLFGFLSERLLPIWIEKNNLKYKTFFKFNTQWKKFLILKIKRKFEK